MSRYIVVRGERKCKWCLACMTKCKKMNRLQDRVRMTEPFEGSPLRDGLQQLAIMTCHHCAAPLCLEACTRGAVYRTPDGVVMVREEACDGCGACVDACPWHVPVVPEAGSPKSGSMVKCTLCDGRAANGEIPECVTACRQEALKLVRADQASSDGFRKSGLMDILLDQA
jgi:Fe-S-cluster-containing dehydrogenase component